MSKINKLKRPPFQNAPVSPDGTAMVISRTNNKLVDNVRPDETFIQPFLNRMFPGGEPFRLSDAGLYKQFAVWSGSRGPTPEANRAMRQIVGLDYEGWTDFAADPNLTGEGWKPIQGDNSFTEVPWMPSPTSPPDNKNRDILEGYGRLPSPEGYGEAVLERGGDYKDYLLDEELSSDEKRRQVIRNSVGSNDPDRP